jgi:hypothetical protein
LVNTYTFVVYASSSIYVPSVLLIEQRFGVGEFKASLGLALYVLGMFNVLDTYDALLTEQDTVSVRSFLHPYLKVSFQIIINKGLY